MKNFYVLLWLVCMAVGYIVSHTVRGTMVGLAVGMLIFFAMDFSSCNFNCICKLINRMGGKRGKES